VIKITTLLIKRKPNKRKRALKSGKKGYSFPVEFKKCQKEARLLFPCGLKLNYPIKLISLT